MYPEKDKYTHLINLGGIIYLSMIIPPRINGTTETCTFSECHKSLGSNSKIQFQRYQLVMYTILGWLLMPHTACNHLPTPVPNPTCPSSLHHHPAVAETPESAYRLNWGR
jgi:hypothetical protein